MQLGQLHPTGKDDSDDYPALRSERRLLHPVPLGNPSAVLPPIQECPGRPSQGDGEPAEVVEVAVHQTAVKEGKEKSVIAKATLLRCWEQAAKAIPELLSNLSFTFSPTQGTHLLPSGRLNLDVVLHSLL